jgi:hypothetical protein
MPVLNAEIEIHSRGTTPRAGEPLAIGSEPTHARGLPCVMMGFFQRVPYPAVGA